MKRSYSLILSICAILMLAACGNMREDLGLGRSSPDEFAVVDRAPLSMPPDFTLRPPKPGEPRPQEVDPSIKANNVLFGNNANAAPMPTGSESGAESELLTATGADKANPDIRTVVDREASQKVVGSTHLVQELLWWKKNEKPTTTVDAAAEAARIKAAKDQGQPINKGATPVIERDKSGWLGL